MSRNTAVLMRILISTIYILSITVVSFSQSAVEKLSASFLSASVDLPADQVFLHIDRNLYHPGDTIRFQAYIRDRQTGIFETNSISLYSMLLNSDHKTIDSARFRISNSSSPGWLLVPENTPLGDYSIKSFTSTMMNYDTGYVFSAPIRIDRLRPVQPQPDTKSDIPGFTPYQIPLTQPAVDLRFLPEGGTFIYGIEHRLAFNAVTSTGKTLNVEGEIRNQNGKKISDFKSGPYGPGLVEFTPIQGDTYLAYLRGDEFTGMKWQLPEPVKSGMALRVNTIENGVIEIEIEGEGVSGKTHYFSLIMNNILVLSKELKIDSVFRFKVSTEELPIGTAYITLFDNELKPVAERLVFVNDHKKMKIAVSSTTSLINRGEETELTINTTGIGGENLSSVVSVSVIDSISGYNSSFPLYDIESLFLFDREFYNKLPSKIKLPGLHNIDRNNIDILLMTYGWRKFNIRNNSEPVPLKELVNYDYLKLSNPGPKKRVRSDFKVMTLEGSDVITLLPDVFNEASLSYDSLDASVRQIMVMPDKNSAKNAYPVIIEFPENKHFTDRAKLTEGFKNDFNIDIPLQKKDNTFLGLDSAIMIEAVTIKGTKKPPIVYVNKYQEQYQFASTTTVSKKEMTGCFNLEDILARLQPYYLDTKAKMIYLRPDGRTLTRGTPSALFVVDDVPLIGRGNSRTYDLIASMPADQISSVTALEGTRGFTFYGEDALGGVVFVTTVAKNRMNGYYEDSKSPGDRIKNDLMKPFRIFRSDIEYYIPAKEEVATIPDYQFRQTLLWKNEVILDGTGPVKIKYPNNMVRGTVMVIVNGVSFTNIPGSGDYKYTVK